MFGILKVVLHFLGFALKLAYNVAKYFHLRLIALFLATSLVVRWAFADFAATSTYEVLLIVGLSLLIIRTVYLCLFKKNKEDKKKTPKIKKQANGATEIPLPPKQNLQYYSGENTIAQMPVSNLPQYDLRAVEGLGVVSPVRINYPVYSRVAQNSNYVMAEYADRYILYYSTVNGLKYVRTDYKADIV